MTATPSSSVPVAPALQALDVFHCPPHGSQLIEASAGTGKTWNICGLYLRLLLERQFTVQQILVVTFTNAATAELRERIRGRLAETLAALRGEPLPPGDPFVPQLLQALAERGLAADTLRALADEALQGFDEAAIFTIHGFCQRALADAPFASGLPLHTELLADDGELVAQVVQDFWRAEVVAAPAPRPLAAHLLDEGDSPERWARWLRERLARPLNPALWPADLDEPLGDFGEAALRDAHGLATRLWRDGRPAIVEALAQVRDCLNGTTFRDGTLDQAIADWDALCAADDPLAPLPAKAHLLGRGSLKLTAKKAQGRRLAEHPFWDAAQALADAHTASATARHRARLQLLRRLFEQGPAALRALKRERRVVAFDDMLANLHDRLVAPGSALPAAVRERFPAALIDEFQDTDPLQFRIFERVYLVPEAQGAPLFFVGDPKQAIYSFRNADLPTYLRAASRVAARHTLGENQRSTGELITALNGLFGANPQAFVVDGLRYQPVACGAKPRQPLTDTSGAPRAALQLWTLPTAPEGAALHKAALMAQVARATAAEIARLLQAAQHGQLMLGRRPVGGGDIAVLVRSHAQGALMRQALAALGVGSVELSQASVWAGSDADDLQHLLAAVLEPGRDPVLRRALATQLIGLDAPAIDALGQSETAWLGWVERLASYQALWRRAGVGVMLRRLLHDEGIGQRLLGRADGERRMTNLLHLAELLQQAQAEGHDSPAALMRWLAHTRREALAGRQDEAAQLRLESDRQLVQIVTIHKSKGLEYPIVFCPFLWAASRRMPKPLDAVAREYAGPGDQRVVDFAADREDKAIKQALAMEQAAEDLRLIYVALTRAVHRCVLPVGHYATGSRDKPSVSESGKAPLAWLAAGAGMPALEWFTGKPPVDRPAAIAAAWQALAARHAPHVGLAELPDGPGQPVALPQPDPAALVALPAPAHLPPAWWIGSYSSLAGGSRHEAAAADRDETPGSDEPAVAVRSSPVALVPDDILRFPRGAAAGSCLHAVFERIDFTDASTVPTAIEAGLRAWPPALEAAGVSPDEARAMLGRLVHDVLQVPIPTPAGPLRLASVPPGRRLVELEFNLPSERLRAHDLGALLAQHGYPVPALAFAELRGYLRGFIDLVVEHGGRYLVLDWKSNHLGDRPADYDTPSLQAAMRAHGYALQYLLYTVALHRYLGHALPGYDYDTHFGGVAYLFVRGMRPGWTTASGEPAGVFTDRPPRALVQALSALLGEPAGALP